MAVEFFSIFLGVTRMMFWDWDGSKPIIAIFWVVNIHLPTIFVGKIHQVARFRLSTHGHLRINMYGLYVLLLWLALWKVNIDPENDQFLVEMNLPTLIWQGLC